MKLPHTQRLAPDVPGGFRRVLWIGLILIAVLTVSTAPLHDVWAQDAQPTTDPAQVEDDPLAPQDDATAEPTQPADEPQEASPSPTAAPADDNDTPDEASQQGPTVSKDSRAVSPGFPAVLANGLAYLGGDDVVWQVREIEVPDESDAESGASEEALLFQVEGTTIIRNDSTGKRAMLHPGDAYFRTSDDSYTIATEDNTSILWQFELVNQDDVALDAIYESPTVDTLDEGVFDMELVRYVLQPGEKADLPENSGAGLVFVANGQAVVETGDASSGLKDAQGKSFDGEASVSNNGDQPAVVLYAYLGDEVGDTIAGSGTGSDSTTDSGDDTADDGTSGTTETSNDDGTTTEEDSSTLQEEADPATDTQEAAPAEQTEDGSYVTSINVTAGDTELYVVMTVDGVTVYDGPLPAGASTGPVVGSVFEVYTSYGAGTTFTNACGETFQMGTEEGEVTYTLVADENSCAP